jgi:hypothetical protein
LLHVTEKYVFLINIKEMLDLKNIRFSPDFWYAIFINVVYKKYMAALGH